MSGLFALLAVALLVSAVQVVRTRDLVRGVLWLAVALISTAGAYVMLAADLLAAVQLMLYAGGVITLMLFAVMLTERLSGSRVLVGSRTWGRGVGVGVLLFALIAAAVLRTELPSGELTADSQVVGELFLTRHVAAFEALSVLLLAAMVGAIVLARRKDA